ncbi:MAG: hypothetical protein GTO00_09110 [Deltaproteobacteria bacterium]|nr:hypothetical protein [Deltaproteobacteria bacterium]
MAAADRIRGGVFDDYYDKIHHAGTLLMGYLAMVATGFYTHWIALPFVILWFFAEKPGWGDCMGKMMYSHKQWKHHYKIVMAHQGYYEFDSIYLDNGWVTGVLRGAVWGAPGLVLLPFDWVSALQIFFGMTLLFPLSCYIVRKLELPGDRFPPTEWIRGLLFGLVISL